MYQSAGGGLFGFTGRLSGSVADTPNEVNYFFWSAEAAFYFVFDNVFDELRIGLRWHGEHPRRIGEATRNLLLEVGLPEISEDSHLISPWELSGGQQQRLLVAVIISRRIPSLVGFNPLIYVQESDRAQLYALVGRMIQKSGGTLIVSPERGSLANNNTLFRTVTLKRTGTQRTSQSSRVEHKDVSGITWADNQPSQSCPPTLALRDIVWTYDNGVVGVTVPHLELGVGRVYIVCGPNGAGKSSLLRALISNWKVPKTSQLEFLGRQVRNPFKELVRNGEVAFTFQDPNLHVAGGTVRDYLGPCGVDEGTVEALRLRDYLDQDLLSSPLWVRQVTVLTTAVFSKSRLVILDEPLDGFVYDIVGHTAIELIRRTAETGATILVITHNPRLGATISSRYIWVADGVARMADSPESVNTISGLREWLASARCE